MTALNFTLPGYAIEIRCECGLARNYGLSDPEVNRALRLIREKEDDVRRAWNEHFGS